MRRVETLSRTFSARIKAVEALIRAIPPRADNAAELRDAANELDRCGPYFHQATTGAVYAAFAELLRTTARLVDWRAAVLNARPDPDGQLRSAKELHNLWLNDYQSNAAVARLVAASDGISTASSIEDVGAVCRSIASTPLPIAIFAEELHVMHQGLRERMAELNEPEKEEPPELSVAFLRFVIDGKAADETHYMTPGEAHDLDIEVRVTRWPEHADELKLTPVTIEPSANYEFPVFTFQRPEDSPPYRMHKPGRAVLRVAQGMQASPFEFKYAASFHPRTAEQPVSVVGQRTLRVEAFDLGRTFITGYPGVDQKLLTVRDGLRREIGISKVDLESVLTILKPLGNLAGRALQDALFRNCTSETTFQSELRNELRRDPVIGSQLEEHPRAGAGITDLSFRGIRIELKYEDGQVLALADCERFAEQTISYVVGTGKRVGILCVLDNTAKTSAAFPAEAGIDVLTVVKASSAIHIVTVLLQGNLARPSDLSR